VKKKLVSNFSRKDEKNVKVIHWAKFSSVGQKKILPNITFILLGLWKYLMLLCAWFISVEKWSLFKIFLDFFVNKMIHSATGTHLLAQCGEFSDSFAAAVTCFKFLVPPPTPLQFLPPDNFIRSPFW